MRIFPPRRQITYTTKLSKKEVLVRLSENIDQEIDDYSFGFSSSKSSKLYLGTLTDNDFSIKRQISYRNSFLPRISGSISEMLGSTEIKVDMKLHKFVVVFMCFWLSIVTFACISILGAFSLDNLNPFLLIPYGMLIFGVLMPYFFFKSESNISDCDLRWILQAETVK